MDAPGKSSWIIFAVGFWSLWSAQPAQGADEPHMQTAPPGEVLTAAQEILEQNHVPGAGLAVVSSHGVEWAGGVGTEGCGRGRPITQDTLFRVGSISKTVIALAVMKLVERGQLSLDGTIADIAPEVRIVNPWEAQDPVRLAHVLEHTAGFDDMMFSEAYNLSDPPDYPLTKTLQKFREPLRVRWPPASRMSYSNTGYGVLGVVIEKVTGRPFEDYIRTEILRPLGMKHSDFLVTSAVKSYLAAGCEGSPPAPLPYRNIYLRPAGELKTSPAEFALLLQMLLRHGLLPDGARLLTSASVDLMETPKTSRAARAGLRSGYGFGIAAKVDFPLPTYQHGGTIDGFTSVYRFMPDLGLGYLVFFNSSTPGNALHRFDKLLFDHLTRGASFAPEPRVDVALRDLDRWTGSYDLASPRNQALSVVTDLLDTRRIYDGGGALYSHDFLKPVQALVPVSATQFRRSHESRASMIFLVDEAGRRVLADANGNYYVEVSRVWPIVRLALVCLAAVLMVSEIPFAAFLIARSLRGRAYPAAFTAARLLLACAVVALGAAAALLTLVATTAPSAVASWIVFVLTLLFPLCSAAGLVLSARSFGLSIPGTVRTHALLVAISCCSVAAYLAFHRLLPLLLWNS